MDFLSLKNIFQKKKKNFQRYIFGRISSQPKAKNFMISFFHPLGLNGLVSGENFRSSMIFFSTSNVSDEKSVLITFISSGNEISNSQSPFLDQFLGADFKLSFILPIKPKVFPFLRMEDGFHFLQKLKG